MQRLKLFYERLIVGRPVLTLVGIGVVVGLFAFFAQNFRLDASSDSLLLEDDQDLRYLRAIRARYGSDDYLVVTYTTDGDIFAAETLTHIGDLRDELAAIDGIAGVISLLDVPLINSPRTTLKALQSDVPTLLSPGTDIALARTELTSSPLYRELIMSRDGHTTALLGTFTKNPHYESLLTERDVIRVKRLAGEITADDRIKLKELNLAIKKQRAAVTQQQQKDIVAVRSILDRYRDRAEIRLGGLPMIVTDMLDYIRHDVIVFGVSILIFLVVLLTVIFVRPRWVVLAMLSCSASVILMTGYLGLTNWPVTVVSANFVALLLIFSLSITVHLIVRYRELHHENPDQDQRWLVTHTLRDKFVPCAFTAITTMVAFASFIVSGIRPVIDFGWMMTIGMVVVMVVAFTLFPAGLMLLAPRAPQRYRATTGSITGFLADLIQKYPLSVFLFYGAVAVMSVVGIAQLSVENRFIDNFRESTEIYQGMITIDRELGGTTPLDIILEADPAFFESDEGLFGDDEFDDEFADELQYEFGVDEGDLGSSSYWYNMYQLETVRAVHNYLESLPETGKVLSMATTIDTLQTINDGPPSTFWLSILYKRLPVLVKSTLFDPFMSSDGNQMRFSVRVYESNPDLNRKNLLTEIRSHLVDDMGFAPERVHLTGMLVLYNNVLQSLYKSQILTLGLVFAVILVMFVFLYKSFLVALIAIVPNILAAGAVMGVMGLFSIPLDIMTITIAAIIIGIGLDDSIHYLHRFRVEFKRDRHYQDAMRRSHGSIGRAMYYTSIIITSGFSILVLSNFIPTIYFGFLIGLAMIFALVANLTLLPLLLIWLKPLGPQEQISESANAPGS